MKPPHCKLCERPGHYQYQCYLKPRSLPQPVLGKVIETRGKQFRNWQACRKEWYKLNPPDFDGYYYCHYCNVAMQKNDSTLDHKLIRSRYPQFRYDLDNLLICCWTCNTKRGSQDYEVFVSRFFPHLKAS